MGRPIQTALITGATSGLGLALARELLREATCELVLPARNAQRGRELIEALGPAASARVSTPVVDLAQLPSVRSFATQWVRSKRQMIDIVVLNAGVQSAASTLFTSDQLEQTFAVNHLAHHVLLRNLEPMLAPNAAVAWVGSGTHHPERARLFGYTGARYLAPQELAQGHYGEATQGAQASRDAYSTSKGLNIIAARHWARLSKEGHPGRHYFAFDPGLMPGTGLAREGSAVQRWAWKNILPLAATFMKGTSTPARSSAMLARLLLRRQALESGSYVEFTGGVLQPHLPNDEGSYCQQLFEFSDRFA